LVGFSVQTGFNPCLLSDILQTETPNKHKVLSHNEAETYVSKSKDSLTQELADLLNETAEAHHKAFAATDGVDDEWPIWYADYLVDKMRIMLDSKFTKSELIYILVSAEKQNGLVAPGAYWPRFYANFIVNRYK
jgi:hypothetical protein